MSIRVNVGSALSVDVTSRLQSPWLTFLPFATEDGQDRLQTLTLADTLQSMWGKANPTEKRCVWAKEPEPALLHASLRRVLPLAQSCSSLAKE
jgi:hypothetical protein